MTVASVATRLHAELGPRNADFVDMRSETHLELSMIGPAETERRPSAGDRSVIERFEETPVAMRRIPDPAAPTQLRYFLDGTQRTMPAYLFETVPLLVCTGVAGILERSADGVPDLMPGSLRMRTTWLAPRRSSIASLNEAIAVLEAMGETVIDPLAESAEDPAVYAAQLDDYAGLIERAYVTGTEQRAAIEADLLEWWSQQAAPDSGWMVVDGALKGDYPSTIGLVKSFTRQYLAGPEAGALFRLPQHHRTSAFQVRDKWRVGTHTCWYQRFWNPSGRDVRHALVRVETSDRYRTSEEIDQLAGWLMIERLPRATADQRWATLLYPVHYLERILKRRLDAEFRGWPTPR